MHYIFLGYLDKSLTFDQPTLRGTRPSIAKACIEMDLTVKPPNDVNIAIGKGDGYSQPVVHERFPRDIGDNTMPRHLVSQIPVAPKASIASSAPSSNLHSTIDSANNKIQTSVPFSSSQSCDENEFHEDLLKNAILKLKALQRLKVMLRAHTWSIMGLMTALCVCPDKGHRRSGHREDKVLKRDIPWETYMTTKLITGTCFQLLRRYDKISESYRAILLDDDGPAYIRVFVNILRNIIKEETVEYVLALIDEMLTGKGSFLTISSELSPHTSIAEISKWSASFVHTDCSGMDMFPDIYEVVKLIEEPSERWIIEVNGASGTLYSNETYQLQVDFPEHYPMEAPQSYRKVTAK
ncbi:hypothetical protein GIB67_008178 [Kingdonia uniflora]|uniref:UBC core domain-containing protein n=1 Tax=Kingdonia uniflora TaxID=39325 RepID=A0A7J7LUQ0_9MAGN|nr:hypothetical protein GIB67_008178 [Kingdonia uniflora]